jgi:hypothetical protein
MPVVNVFKNCGGGVLKLKSLSLNKLQKLFDNRIGEENKLRKLSDS